MFFLYFVCIQPWGHLLSREKGKNTKITKPKPQGFYHSSGMFKLFPYAN